MNKKNIILTLGLSLAIGAGFLGGLTNTLTAVNADAVPSGGSTLYLNTVGVENGDEKFGIWYWGGSCSSTWLEGTAFTGKANVYTYTLPEGAEHFLVARANKEIEGFAWDGESKNIWNKTNDIDFDSNKNYLKLTGYDSDLMNFEYSKRYTATIMDGDEILKVDFASSEDEYEPYISVAIGKYYSIYTDKKFGAKYVKQVLSNDIVLYAKVSDLENTAYIYFEGYSWDAHKVYAWENIDGREFYARGVYNDAANDIGNSKMINVEFQGHDIYRVAIKYHDISNVNFLYFDGTDENKSSNTALANGQYFKFKGDGTSDLVGNENLGKAADVIWSIVSKMTETGVTTSYGDRDYTICDIKNSAEKRAVVVEGYNSIRENTEAKAAFDGAKLNTYVAGEGTTYEEYGQVSFSEIINEIAGYDIVTSASAPSYMTFKQASNSGLNLVVIISSIALGIGALAFVLVRKKKCAR